MNAQTEIVGPCCIMGRAVIGGYIATISVIPLRHGGWGISYKPCRDRYGHQGGETHPYRTLAALQRSMEDDGLL